LNPPQACLPSPVLPHPHPPQLAQGQLVVVHPGLIKRQRTHFATFEPLGVDAILGLNGLVWVAPHVARGEDGAALGGDQVGALLPAGARACKAGACSRPPSLALRAPPA
jgi:hypothetical protein